jgi:hypothetical protein
MDETYASIPVTKIAVDPVFQVRQQWDPQHDSTLASLTESLRGPEGLIHPLVVVALATPTTFGRTFTLIAGHRRLIAAQQAGYDRILARVLPPCDLTDPAVRLRLCAIALKENTERDALTPDDRRGALRRLQSLYDAVYPAVRAPRHPPAAAPVAPSFPQWAATQTGIPLRTIQRDLCRVLMQPRPRQDTLAPVEAPAPAVVVPSPLPSASPSGADSAWLTAALTASQQATAAFQSLAVQLTPTVRTQLTPGQHATLTEHLAALHSALAQSQAALTTPTATPLAPFAMLLWEHAPTVSGALWGLARGTPAAWTAVPPALRQTIQTVMTPLLTAWAQVEAHLTPARSPLRLMPDGHHEEAAP